MRVCDTMAGIGGWSLAFEAAGADILWQVERDPLRQKVLREHWPFVSKKSDLRQISAVGDFKGEIDVLTASLSFMHHGENGTFDALWRVIDQLTPRWLVIEHRPELFDIRNLAMGKELEKAAHDRGYFYQYAVINSLQIDDSAVDRYRGYMVAYQEAFRNCLPTPHSEGAYPEKGISRTGRYLGKPIGIRTAEQLMGFDPDWSVSILGKFRWDVIREATSVQVAKEIAENIMDVEEHESSSRAAREGQVAAIPR
jgi:site-specific DNA-cytosine methylase